MSKVRISPALVVSALALFFALGGSALALTHKPLPSQPRCSAGAVRGVAEVTGQTGKGPANIPDQFSATASYFTRAFNCAGGGVQVRRLTTGVYEVRFPGNAATSAVASAEGTDAAAAAVQRLSSGAFHVTVGYPDQLKDEAFTIVAF